MTTLRKEDIAELSNEELDDKVKAKAQELHDQRFLHLVSPLENPLLLRALRRDVARLKTEQKNRKMTSKTAVAAEPAVEESNNDGKES